MNDKIPFGKTSICAYYSECREFNLDELGIDAEQVDSFCIRHCKLEITYKDGTKAEYDDTSEFDVDYSTPDNIEFND